MLIANCLGVSGDSLQQAKTDASVEQGSAGSRRKSVWKTSELERSHRKLISSLGEAGGSSSTGRSTDSENGAERQTVLQSLTDFSEV